MKVLALDVGGTAIKSALITDGQIIMANEFPSEGKLGGPHIIHNIMRMIDLYKDYDVIGISTTGQVDSIQGSIIYANDNVPNYTGTNLSKIITDKYHKPVYVENDVNAAAIGEGYMGAGRNEIDFLCLTYGTGIGGAIIMNKQVYKGSHGVAGEMGHILTHIDGLRCTCGQHGCYEQYASTTALIRETMHYNENLNNGKLVFSALEEGNKMVKTIIDSWINEIIYGLINVIHIFNPSCIILGGGIMEQTYIIDSINTRITDKLMNSFKDIKIVAAELGNNAGVYGMAAIANERILV